MGRRTRGGLIVALAVLALLLTSCVRPQPRLVVDLSLRATTPIEAMLHHVTPAWTIPFRAVSRPVVTGGVVLVHESAGDGQLDLVALDLADGRERWRTPTSLGSVGDGSEPWITSGTFAGHPVVAYLTPPQRGLQTLVLAEVATGRVVQQQPVGTAGILGPCRVIGGFCVERVEGTQRTLLRVDPQQGTLAPLRLRQGPVEQVRNLGDGGYLIRRGNATFVGVDGELGHWEKPVSAWLGRDLDPATSWLDLQFDTTGAQLRVTARIAPLGTAASFPATEVVQASVNLSDGELLWSRTGRSFVCPGNTATLSCTGDRLEFTRTNRGTGVRPGGGLVRYVGLDAGGEELWHRDVANPVAPASGGLAVRSPANTPVIGSNNRLITLDPETGEPTTLGDDHWLACEAPRTFRGHQRADPTRPLVDFRGITHVACNPSGTTAAEPAQFTIAGLLAVAATESPAERDPEVPGHYAVALPEQLAVFR
ncbi:PQQ-binding-like beta-propeller repeat protein [Naumannella sp. ID2617S]|nr:PQQ-binding-like beta-propeller repeat protein [Naumannella sp. ID2617S]